VTKTPELIDSLVRRATPVRRLSPPLVRAGLWLAFAALVLVLLAVGHGVRGDFAARMRDPEFVISMSAALATGILSAVAAFAVSIPDRSRWLALLPIPALAVWVATIGLGCLTDWVSVDPDGMHVLGEEMRCFAILVFTSVPLTIALGVMLRYAALLRAGPVVLLGGLAVAAITATAVSLLHNHNASAIILVWNLGTAALMAGAAGVFGRRMLGWFAARLGTERTA
jgi:hypothetical protein